MDLIERAYKSTRDGAKNAFDAVAFDASNKKKSLEGICSNNLKRYDAEIEWYEKHADKKRFWSAAVRIISVILGTASLLLINIRAFSPVGSNGKASTLFGLDYATLATSVAILAGSILLLDLVFQITKRYGSWRVMEYKIRIKRIAFDIAFKEKYGAAEDSKIDVSLFNDARIMANQQFNEILKEIETETENWQQNLDKAMINLRQRIDKTDQEAKAYSASADQEIIQAQKASAFALLTVNVKQDASRIGPLTLIALGAGGTELDKKGNLAAGQKYPFILKPGPYIFRLLDKSENELDSISKRLKPGIDDDLTI